MLLLPLLVLRAAFVLPFALPRALLLEILPFKFALAPPVLVLLAFVFPLVDVFEFVVVVVVFVVFVVTVVFVLTFAFPFALFVLSAEVHAAPALATVSKARRARVRRIEFPPVPSKGQIVGELHGLSHAVSLERFRNSSMLMV